MANCFECRATCPRPDAEADVVSHACGRGIPWCRHLGRHLPAARQRIPAWVTAPIWVMRADTRVAIRQQAAREAEAAIPAVTARLREQFGMGGTDA